MIKGQIRSDKKFKQMSKMSRKEVEQILNCKRKEEYNRR